jgi:DNA polymerase I-like protein with 3'-5' exonuclease and polymerase domains
MRWACICSGDPKLTEIFLSGVDIHGAIAKEVFNLDCHPNEVKFLFPELRDIAKTIQFLTLYGGRADTLASKVKIKKKRALQILQQMADEIGQEGVVDPGQATVWLMNKFRLTPQKAAAVIGAADQAGALMAAFTITKAQAQDLLDQYFEKYSGVNNYIHSTTEFTKVHGYSLSLLGRKRRVPAVRASDKNAAEAATRQAVNATIQSIASDGLMLSAYKLLRHLQETGEDRMRLMGPIHDAIYCMVKEDFIIEARDLLLKFMTEFPEQIDSPIPMCSDAEWGHDWAHFSEDFDDAGFAELYQEEEENEDGELAQEAA